MPLAFEKQEQMLACLDLEGMKMGQKDSVDLHFRETYNRPRVCFLKTEISHYTNRLVLRIRKQPQCMKCRSTAVGGN